MPKLERPELEISVDTNVIKNFSKSPIKNKVQVFNPNFIEGNLQLKEGQAKTKKIDQQYIEKLQNIELILLTEIPLTILLNYLKLEEKS